MEHGQDMELSPHPTVVMRALLIDLDNCPRQIERLPEALTEYVRVIACYGGAEPKVPLGMVPLLATAIHEGRLAIIGMQKKGKNAADFGLAFWAGRLAAEMPPDTEFLILSQDTDLDHVVHLLQGANRRVERLEIILIIVRKLRRRQSGSPFRHDSAVRGIARTLRLFQLLCGIVTRGSSSLESDVTTTTLLGFVRMLSKPIEKGKSPPPLPCFLATAGISS